jgi:hypothetical protein
VQLKRRGAVGKATSLWMSATERVSTWSVQAVRLAARSQPAAKFPKTPEQRATKGMRAKRALKRPQPAKVYIAELKLRRVHFSPFNNIQNRLTLWPIIVLTGRNICLTVAHKNTK